jgi:pimeloyl-ACP methyl ester carboxylesterase
MKTVLFVSGFREDIRSRDYKNTLNAIKSKGYEVKFVPINWARTIIKNWTKELDKEYSKHVPSQTILAGFSYGSMTAFMSATRKNPAELWLFSFSPYFSDDMPKMKKSWLSNIGHRRADAFRALDFNKLAKTITCKTLIIVGEVEAKKYPLIGNRSQVAYKAIKNSRLITVAGSDYDVADKNYIAAIAEAI